MMRLLALLLLEFASAVPVDFYGLLGVTSDASQKHISTAFRKLSMRFHPDKNMDKREEAERRMRELSEAYTVLNNTDDRRIYDASRASIPTSKNETPGYTPGHKKGHWTYTSSHQSHSQAQPQNARARSQPPPQPKQRAASDSYYYVRFD